MAAISTRTESTLARPGKGERSLGRGLPPQRDEVGRKRRSERHGLACCGVPELELVRMQGLTVVSKPLSM